MQHMCTHTHLDSCTVWIRLSLMHTQAVCCNITHAHNNHVNRSLPTTHLLLHTTQWINTFAHAWLEISNQYVHYAQHKQLHKYVDSVYNESLFLAFSFQSSTDWCTFNLRRRKANINTDIIDLRILYHQVKYTHVYKTYRMCTAPKWDFRTVRLMSLQKIK